MRELLAVEAVASEPSVVALAVVGVVAMVVMVPILALCGSCDEREPDPGPFDRRDTNMPGSGVSPGYQGAGYVPYPQQPHQQQAQYPHQYHQPVSQGYSGYQQSGSQYAQHPPHGGHNGGYSANAGMYQQQPPQQQPPQQHPSQQFPPQQRPGHGYHHSQGSGYQHGANPQPAHAPPGYQQQYPGGRPQSASGGPGVPSGTHLQPADVTLGAVEAVLFQVCDGMKGMIKPGKTLVRETIRTGVSAVIADVTTNYAVDETMMLFPDKNKKSRQMRLYEQLNLKDSMPLVSVDTEIFSHEENGRKVTLPAAIFVNRVKTLADTLQGMKTIEEKQAELFGIWSQLAKVLKMFHQRGWYLRDVTYENVVHVRMGATEGWTLLEFGNASRPKSSINKNTIPPRQCPPELASEMLTPNDEKVHLSVAGDMWMLGMLVYQVMTGEPYWKPSLKDSEVLQIMADPNRPLPHKEKPVLNLVQLILESLLHRDPSQRLTSSDLIKRLEQDMATAGAKTINPGPAVVEKPIELQGT